MNNTIKLVFFALTILALLYVYHITSPRNATPVLPIVTSDAVEEACPVKNFVFVKTHKTGSSTMSNILLRYCENHRLNLLLGGYPTGTEYHYLPTKFYPPPPPGESYNAFVMHANYNYNFLRSKLPQDTKFFTIVRHPVSRYISGFRFFKSHKNYDKEDFDHSIQKHLKANKEYLVSTTQCEGCQNLVNSVAVDLGFNFNKYFRSKNKTLEVEKFIANLDQELELVLVMEYFDLSLVLLARQFCWTFEDIAYLKSLESASKPHVSEETKAMIFDFQKIDAAIYDYYNKTFWNKISKEEGIFEDLEKFQRYNEATKDKCVSQKKVGNFQFTMQYELTEFGKNDFQCLAMTSRVLPFVHLLEKRNQGIHSDGPHQSGMLTLDDVYKNRDTS